MEGDDVGEEAVEDAVLVDEEGFEFEDEVAGVDEEVVAAQGHVDVAGDFDFLDEGFEGSLHAAEDVGELRMVLLVELLRDVGVVHGFDLEGCGDLHLVHCLVNVFALVQPFVVRREHPSCELQHLVERPDLLCVRDELPFECAKFFIQLL